MGASEDGMVLNEQKISHSRTTRPSADGESTRAVTGEVQALQPRASRIADRNRSPRDGPMELNRLIATGDDESEAGALYAPHVGRVPGVELLGGISSLSMPFETAATDELLGRGGDIEHMAASRKRQSRAEYGGHDHSSSDASRPRGPQPCTAARPGSRDRTPAMRW